MAQQTAVEWLYHKLSTCTSDEMVGNINNWFEQAKQMEKDQINQACYDGYYQEEPIDVREYYDRVYKK